MNGCRYLHGTLCVLGRCGGRPTPEDCGACGARKPAAGIGCPLPVAAEDAIDQESRMVGSNAPRPRRANVMLGGSWFDHPAESCLSCESKRRFARDWFAAHDDDEGEVAGYAAD